MIHLLDSNTQSNFISKAFLVLTLVCSFSIINAQPNDDNSNTEERLAGQYYQLEQWDLAADMYKILYDKQPSSFNYSQLLNCYMNLKDDKSSEKLINKQIKRYPQQLNYLVDLGYFYQMTQEEKKAEKQFEKALKELNPSDERQVLELANAFLAKEKIDYAEKTYLDARSRARKAYNFELELASIYKQTGKTDKMLDEYFRLLTFNPQNYLESIQNRLQDMIFEDTGNEKTELLRERLIKEVQRNPDNLLFSDLLVWMFIQKKDFGAAITQSKALDKRLNESGGRVLEVARICMKNEAFEEGKSGYEYLLLKAPESNAYKIAKRELAIASYDRLIRKGDFSQEQLQALKNILQESLSINTDPVGGLDIAIRMAHLDAFYLNNIEQALELLEPYTLASSGLNLRGMNEAKLEIADIQLLSGDIWEATLTYSQIEKAMKTDTLSQEAKFRNARLAYFQGDFEWAKAQLDVLKAATSKFIANDAMELSLLIGDNLVFDTTGAALTLFAQADLSIYQGKIPEALSILDTLQVNYPESTLADEIIYRQAGIAKRQKNFEQAAKLYQQLVSLYHEDILADNALFELAKITENNLGNKEEAMDYYKALLTEFPGSLFVPEARRRFRALRGDSIQ